MQFTTSLLLKHKEKLYEAAFTPEQWNRIVAELLLVGLLGAGLFGVVMGSLGLSWRMILLIWGPLALCTPALFVFSAIRGSHITLRQLVYLLVGMLATSGVVLLALSPISWFFTWTDTSPDHGVLIVLNALMIVVAQLFGVFYLGKGMITINHRLKTSDVTDRAALDILLVWIILLLIVSVQMSHKLGPWYL